MTNKKKILIETLHGSVAQLNELSSMTEGIDVYDETGHVDTKFLMEALSCVNTFVNASNTVVQKISSLLAPDASTEEKKKQADEGKKWNVEEILKHCTLENNILKLPQVQFNKKSYAEAKKWIEEAGGSWQGGKIQGFTFPFNPERVFSILKEGKRCNLQQDYQFFETPSDVADWLVMLAGGIHEDDTVLEPSAGRGALIKAIHRACPSVMVECYELMPENREFLHTLSNVILLDEDFTKDSVGSYTKIIANPPFSGNQDIEHVRLMYDRLEEGGTLAAITSQHWKFASEKKCIDFRNWLKEVHGEVFEISAGEFKESGTSVSTMAVVIKKIIQNNIKMNKEEFQTKKNDIDSKIRELKNQKIQLEKEYIESNQGFPVGSKVCITVMAHERNNERILVPEAKKLAYIADYEIDDNGEVVPSLRQLDYNGGMSAIPLFVNLKKDIIELV